MTPPYALMRADKSGTETEIKVSDNLRDLLEQRDERREKSSPKSVYWRVLDLDDGERGEAEWCEGDCGRVVFGSGECGVCEAAA